jgi:hypothetical protein
MQVAVRKILFYVLTADYWLSPHIMGVLTQSYCGRGLIRTLLSSLGRGICLMSVRGTAI